MPRPTGTRAPEAGSEEAVWDALGQFYRARQPWIRRASEAAGVPPPQLWVLVYLSEFGPASAGDLAGFLGVTPAAVTFVIHRLRRVQCVELRPAEDDRRRVMVRLLPAGRQKVRRLLRWREDFGHKVLGRFAPTERAEFTRLLRKFAAGMDVLARARAATLQGARSNRPGAKRPRARVHRDSGA